MREQQLLFRFTHAGTEYNIATGSFMFTEGGVWKTAYGTIDGSKSLSLIKDMGVFVWGSQTDYQISDLWILNESQSINNAAGKYDDFLNIPRDTAIEQFVCPVTRGESDYTDWEKVGEYHLDRARNSGDNYIVMSLQTKLVLMDKNTIHQYYPDTLVYSDNRERPRPAALGVILNTPGVLIDDTTNEYEFHDESSFVNVIAAYDDYDPFVEGVDYTEGTLSTGGYGINLSSPADGKITGFLSGGLYSGSATNTYPEFIFKLLTDYADISISDIDTTSADDVQTEFDSRCGVFIPQPQNVRDIIEQLNVMACAYTYINQSGQIAFNYLQEPAVTEDYDLQEYDVVSVDTDPDGAPGLSDSVASQKNWHVFTDGDVALSVSQSDKDKVTREYQSLYTSTTTTSGGTPFDDFYAHARDGCYLKTLAANANKIKDLITHLEALFAVKRNFYVIEVNVGDLLTAMKMNIGETIKLTWPRWGLESGKNLIIKKIEYNDILQRKIRITGWG
jgi:hypothetical protein